MSGDITSMTKIGTFGNLDRQNHPESGIDGRHRGGVMCRQVIKFTAHLSFPVNMAKTKQKGITYTPPTKQLPQLYKLKEKNTTRGSRSSWVKDSWARKTHSVTSLPKKSPSKHTSGSPHLLYEGADFDFDQEKPLQQNDFAQFARRMECIDVMAVSMSHSFAQTVAEFGIKDIHSIASVNGPDHFFKTSLTKVGLHIHLAHDGTPCPSSTNYSSDFFQWSDTDADNNIDNDYPEGPFFQPVRDPDHPAITVVDKSGVHSLSIWYSHCPSALSQDMQLFQAGLFLASFTRPKTAFTFAVLDDFLLDNLECRTSAMNYYSKICRLTSSIFPLMVPDRYRELMRAARQWRQCKLCKWHGFAHKDDKPKDGDLALFCPACPQPGINLDLSAGTVAQLDDTPSWLMTRYLVMDGKFKAEHMHAVNPSDEVSLMDGLGFMVSDERYKSHLAIARDHVQRSDCNNHRAVNQANASRQRLEATGIGGCACARMDVLSHIPWWTFRKAKGWQMNMDYALSQALNYKTDGISRAITFYDINCQYNKYLKDRITSSMYLSIPTGMDIIPGIDGEIMETLWAPLNIISPSARGMGTPHRKEVLDYQMNDCNFMKMICIICTDIIHVRLARPVAKFLSRKLKEAIKGAAESTLAFYNLNETAHPDMVILWEAEETLAHENRADDPTAMDIYEAQNRPEHPDINPPGHRGAATWLATGLTIEESQISLSKDVKRLRMHPTDMQLLRVARCRDKLHTQITSFLEMAPTYLGVEVDVNDPDAPVNNVHNSLHDHGEDYSDLDDDQNPDPDPLDTSIFQPELTVIPLPSNIGEVRCRELGLTNLMKEEIALREGQANDALHAIRVHLGDKALIFRNTVRSAKSQASSTRAWTRVRSVETAVNLNAKIPSFEKDLKASSAVANPNACGQRDTTLSWFWSLDVQGDTSGNDWMTECRPVSQVFIIVYRVNWLWTKALCNRWNEEVILVKHEMQWSINFFNHRAKQWLGHMRNATSAGLTGHACYAARQSHIYEQLAAHAEDSFQKMLVQLEVPVLVNIVGGTACLSHYCITFLSMNNTVTLIPSDQVIIAAKGNQITAADISRALFYANSRLLAMRLHIDKSFAPAVPGYAECFYTLIKWEMEDVLSTMTAHTLADRRLDVNAVFQDIRALRLSADSNTSDDYDIAHMPDYFNDWWKESLGCCRVSDMLPKSCVQDVMDLVRWHFSQLCIHVTVDYNPMSAAIWSIYYTIMTYLPECRVNIELFVPTHNSAMVTIPLDWALYQTYLAGELVHEIFTSTILHRPVKNMDLGLLDIDTCIALEQLTNVMATAYSNAGSEKREEILFNKFPPEEDHFLTTPSVVIDSSGRIIVWYLPGALTAMIMSDIHGASHSMSGLLKHSITTGKISQWRTHRSNLHPSPDGMITPGCINISPAWFQQGREKHGFPNLDPEDGFSPEVSAALKGEAGCKIMVSLQRSGIIVSAALRVIHPDLYWARMETQVRLGTWAAQYGLDDMHHHLQRWTSVFNVVSIICNHWTPPHRDPKCRPAAFDIMTTAGVYHLAIMDFMNLGIKFLYDSGSILASSCRLVRHYMNVEEGNRIVTAWYMRDSIHNFVGTPSMEYAKYDHVFSHVHVACQSHLIS
ncbi:hypothetical protein DEU56DRAFT_758558 [Suillus clintonianus]|uniref:uncharacterized protein n=1 Tax=Suillus clintonianus TaxID=1904413 RepID=UPI001B862027|nr:uncharacterized protein DEU56DRAFT_758558 [Suillus clintonianus]KAG2127671.1 hypothetical protein DEU56DRAFT_758558 [Suillus clintonianus]